MTFLLTRRGSCDNTYTYILTYIHTVTIQSNVMEMRCFCRLAGAAFLAPVINYWWPGFPKNLSSEAYNKQVLGDQWALRVAHYAPWLLHWWMNQSWLPTSTVIKGTTFLPNQLDARMRDYARTSGIAEEVCPANQFYTCNFYFILSICLSFCRE